MEESSVMFYREIAIEHEARGSSETYRSEKSHDVQCSPLVYEAEPEYCW